MDKELESVICCNLTRGKNQTTSSKRKKEIWNWLFKTTSLDAIVHLKMNGVCPVPTGKQDEFAIIGERIIGHAKMNVLFREAGIYVYEGINTAL